jgi:hypothetical protein
LDKLGKAQTPQWFSAIAFGQGWTGFDAVSTRQATKQATKDARSIWTLFRRLPRIEPQKDNPNQKLKS